MRIPVVSFAVAALSLVACGAQQNPTPAAQVESRSSGVQPDHRSCPSHFNYCMKLNPRNERWTTICYPYTRGCEGRSYSSYGWSGTFYSWPKLRPVNFFDDSFSPNPGEKPLDGISEARPVKWSHNRIGYEQVVCVGQNSVCIANLYIGIWTEP